MDANTGDKVSKGIISAFMVLGAIVLLIGALYLTVYINAIVLGAVFQVSSDDNTSVLVNVDSFIANNVTAQTLTPHIVSGTLEIWNSTGTWNLANFTIDYVAGTVLLKTPASIFNSTTLYANYTYIDVAGSNLPVSPNTKTFLYSTENSFFINNNSVLSGLGFATSLIPIAIILLVLGGIIVGGYFTYKYLKKGKGGDMGY